MTLEELLLTDDVSSYQQEIIRIIPELIPCIGFDQHHPHHHLDVWEHTMLAIEMSPKNFEIRLALLLHDMGKPFSYQVDGDVYHYEGHAKKSCEMAKLILERMNYDSNFVQEVLFLIENHDTEILPEEVEENKDLRYKQFVIQKCDALAHNPTKLEKRKQYIKKVNQYF